MKVEYLNCGDITLSYHKVSGCLRVFMPEINRINVEGLLKLIFILHPEKTKFKIYFFSLEVETCVEILGKT